MPKHTAHTAPVTLRLAVIDDSEAIRGIYGCYMDTPITFEEVLPSSKEFEQRIEGILASYPYLVAEQDSEIIGYAYAHEQAKRAAYRWNAELSIYLSPGKGRKGLGTVMYSALLDLLKAQGICKAYSLITMPNAASKRLHAKLGFKEEWLQKRAGWKNGKWYGVLWMTKQLIPQNHTQEQPPISPTPFPQVDPATVAEILNSANARLAKMAEKPIVSATTHKCMQGNKGSNTKPEQVVRKMLRDMGYPGYRLQWKQCPGKPDITYPGRKLAIFINGCFWHRCPICNLPTPKSNVEYWNAKFARNVERDAECTAAATEAGWTVITLWEHQLEKDQLEQTRQYLYEVVSLTD